MATTNFVDFVTPVMASWLNDVDEKTYNEQINVKLAPYNAVGNGVADDTAAFVAAIAAAATTESRIYIPPGTYKISSTLTLTPNVSIVGAGRDSSIISFTGTGYAFSLIIANHTTSASWINAIYRDFQVKGTVSADGAFYMEYCNFLKWDNMYIKDFTKAGAYGVDLKECYFYRFANNKFESIASACINMRAGALSGCNAGWIGPANEFNGNNQTNCIGTVVRGQGIWIVANDYEGAGNGNKGLDINASDGVLIEGNYIELWNTAIAANSGTVNTRIEVNNNVINASAATVCAFNNGGTPNNRVVFTNNRFADITGGQTCVVFGTTTNVSTSNNDPNSGIFSDLYATDGRYLPMLVATNTYDAPSLTAGSETATTLAVTGASVGDICMATLSSIGTNNITLSAHVQSANTVRVILTNEDAGTIDLASGTLKVVVIKI